MQHKAEYGRMDKLVLHIYNIWSSILQLPHQKIKFHHILHVPHITKCLLSIAQLTNDNKVMAEFNYAFSFVKNQATKKVLLQRTLKDGKP